MAKDSPKSGRCFRGWQQWWQDRSTEREKMVIMSTRRLVQPRLSEAVTDVCSLISARRTSLHPSTYFTHFPLLYACQQISRRRTLGNQMPFDFAAQPCCVRRLQSVPSCTDNYAVVPSSHHPAIEHDNTSDVRSPPRIHIHPKTSRGAFVVGST